MISFVEDDDRVNHPSYYINGGVEIIEFIRNMPFDIANAIKYLARIGRKAEQGYTTKAKALEDARKAKWYIEDYINNIDKFIEENECKSV